MKIEPEEEEEKHEQRGEVQESLMDLNRSAISVSKDKDASYIKSVSNDRHNAVKVDS